MSELSQDKNWIDLREKMEQIQINGKSMLTDQYTVSNPPAVVYGDIEHELLEPNPEKALVNNRLRQNLELQ